MFPRCCVCCVLCVVCVCVSLPCVFGQSEWCLRALRRVTGVRTCLWNHIGASRLCIIDLPLFFSMPPSVDASIDFCQVWFCKQHPFLHISVHFPVLWVNEYDSCIYWSIDWKCHFFYFIIWFMFNWWNSVVLIWSVSEGRLSAVWTLMPVDFFFIFFL